MGLSKQIRDKLREEILSFVKVDDLKKPFIIEKETEYNGLKYPCEVGLKCKGESGMWKSGYTLTPTSQGYNFVQYTVLHGVIKVNMEVALNKKLTPCSHFINMFYMGGMKYYNLKEGNEYLWELLNEWGDNYISEENGWTYSSTAGNLRSIAICERSSVALPS